MDESVRTFEPKMALFAEEDGLAIYQKIAKEASQLLASDGQLFRDWVPTRRRLSKQSWSKPFPQKKYGSKKKIWRGQ